MKSSFLVILSFLLATAILAPVVITLFNIDEKTTVAIDFNEEDQKEEKKEVNEKDFFLDSDLRLLTLLQQENTSNRNFYLQREYSTSIAIFLLPPEHNI